MKNKILLAFEYMVGIILIFLSLLIVGALMTLAYGFCAIWFVFYPVILIALCILSGVIGLLNILFKTVGKLGGIKFGNKNK